MKTNVIIIVVLLLVSIGASARTPGEVEVGGVLREAKLYGFGCDILHLSDLRGKPLIINMWASWREPVETRWDH